jgi:hydroxyacylglutathione hydrolase
MSNAFPSFALPMPEIHVYTGGIAATNGHLLSLPGGTVLVDAPDGIAPWLEGKMCVWTRFSSPTSISTTSLDAAAVKAQHGCRVYAFAPFHEI